MNNSNLGINLSSAAKNFFYLLFDIVSFKQFCHAALFQPTKLQSENRFC